MGQKLLFPDPRPLERLLGCDFFLDAPQRPGVYLMKDAADRVLYIGKAKNLKQRLNHYRVANPERMPRRHLRLLRQVARIEFQLCADEAEALRREASLLLSLKPKYNRAGVWPARERFLVWQVVEETLELSVADLPAPTWRRFGPLGSVALWLRGSLARLLWLAVNPERPLSQMPAGWWRGQLMETTRLSCGSAIGEVESAMERFFGGDGGGLVPWLGQRCSHRTTLFERRAIESELENLTEFYSKHQRRG